MSGLEGARCVGLHLAPLMESTHPADHDEARKLCGAGTNNECPAFSACNGMAKGLQRGPLDHRPVGTWAGRLYGGKVEPKRPGAKRKPREHGTDRGYHQHRTHGDATCADCMAAHRAAVWFRAACEHPLVDISNPLDNQTKETTNASRPRINGADTPTRGLADRLETTDSCTS